MIKRKKRLSQKILGFALYNLSFGKEQKKDMFCRQVKTRACLGEGYLFTTPSRLLTTLWEKPFENIVRKGENAGKQHFHLFTQCHLHYLREKL